MPRPSPHDRRSAAPPSPALWLWLAAAAAAVGYGAALPSAPYFGQPAAKVLMCVLLALSALRHAPMAERVRLCVALAASGAGDVLLAVSQPFSFVGGLAAFLVAHLAYCALFAPLAVRPTGWRRVAIALLWTAAAAVYMAFLPHLGALVLPVAVYMCALCLMASLALSARGLHPLAAIGGFSFVVSDTMIGVDRFLGAFTASTHGIWATYAFAQLALAAAVVLLPRRLPAG